MADASVYVSRVRSSCVLPLWESLKPADESNPDSFQITASALGLRGYVIFCHHLRVMSLFPKSLWLSWK